MSEEARRPFSELLEELVLLYKKLRQDDTFKHPDIEVNGDVDFLLNHFDSIKNTLDSETFENLGEPVRDLLENLLAELKKEVKADPQSYSTGSKQPEKKAPQKTELEIIDEKLKKGGLSINEIDILLDRRAKLQNNKL